MPLSHNTTVRRGSSELGGFVGDFDHIGAGHPTGKPKPKSAPLSSVNPRKDHRSSIYPVATLRKRNEPPPLAQLKVHPSGQDYFDDINLSLLVVERKCLTPSSEISVFRATIAKHHDSRASITLHESLLLRRTQIFTYHQYVEENSKDYGELAERKERKPQASDVAHGSNFIWDGSRDEICDLRSRLWPARADDTYLWAITLEYGISPI
ncbi:hypothetical protein K443DRAFT_622290 [Laccaria amethystina LaAM-08-1]|uniref:Uncharacterized protein n=1 Tax=Laccaria amethystina LaAM-08-1 TaxID=1095629 RepID=A0A0C9Y1T2_9AGAR|nr:hypothetical protein K443DRAFT_622290 [Laccaria amethystina LaAM-08-1]